jgi:hypothetical protein
LISLRILLRVSPRQSPSSAILFEMSSDADWPWLAPDFVMFSSYSDESSRLKMARLLGHVPALRRSLEGGISDDSQSQRSHPLNQDEDIARFFSI